MNTIEVEKKHKGIRRSFDNIIAIHKYYLPVRLPFEGSAVEANFLIDEDSYLAPAHEEVTKMNRLYKKY